MSSTQEMKIPYRRLEQRPQKALADMLLSYITPGIGQVMITDCEQYREALLDVIRDHPDTEFTLTTGDDEMKQALDEYYDPIPNADLFTADLFDPEFTDRTFDLIVSIPPMGGRVPEDKDRFISHLTDLAAAQNLLTFLKPEGELVAVLHPVIAYSSSADIIELRKYLEDHYRIEEIDSIPEGLFSPGTMIRTYLFVFSTGVTKEVLLRQYMPDRPIERNRPCDKLILRKEMTLSREEFAKMSGWNIEMAFSEDTDERKAYDASSVQKAIMNDVATVFRGKAVNTKSEDGQIGVIGISDITDIGIDYSHVVRMDAEDRKIEKYLLKDGDVLVTTRGTAVKVAVVEKLPMRCIPSVNLIVIRPGERIRGTYLKLFLESPVGIQMLDSLRRGGSVMNINYKDVGGLEVPAPPLEVQDALIAKYEEGLKAYTATVSKAEKKWNKTRLEVQSELF